jgi:hypothetical protein
MFRGGAGACGCDLKQFLAAAGRNYLPEVQNKTEKFRISALSAIRVLEPLNCRKCKLELKHCRKCNGEKKRQSAIVENASRDRVRV